MKIRADVRLTQSALAPSREKAQALIMAGKVWAGDRRIQKASEMIGEEENLTVRGDEGFASRGGYKLEKAMDVFHVSAEGMTAMDVGAAAGGFTDILLRNGAKHVYAIDVGYGQLDWRLRNDERVTVMERTNARYLTESDFKMRPQLAVMDVSFISIRIILPALMGILGEEGRIVSLIKPQFEAGRGSVGKHGVVREKTVHAAVLEDIVAFVAGLGWHVNGLTWSPIKGPAGNIEFLTDIVKMGTNEYGADEIRAIVDEAHRELD